MSRRSSMPRFRSASRRTRHADGRASKRCAKRSSGRRRRPRRLPAEHVPRLRRWHLAAAAFVATVLIGITWVAARMSGAPAAVHLMRSDIDVPQTINLGFDSTFAISPDGQWIAIAAGRGLWMRSLRDGALRLLPGTGGGSTPFWSPDSRSIGFFADRKLKRLDLPDGTPAILADAPDGKGGTWSTGGTIVFAPTALGPLMRILARGGETVTVTALDRRTRRRRPPHAVLHRRHALHLLREKPSGAASCHSYRLHRFGSGFRARSLSRPDPTRAPRA